MTILAPKSDPGAHDTQANRLIANADRCVACGLCLPHCPTYHRYADENESPRGRIALLRAYAQGQLPYSVGLRGHIDRCLGCQACESVCPSRVAYNELLTDGRALLAAHDRPLRPYRVLQNLARAPRIAALVYDLTRLGARLGLLRLLPGPWAAALPFLPRRPAYRPPTPVKDFSQKQQVSLFLGCTRRLDGDTVAAAMKIFAYLNFAVSIPRAQGCCGALARHAGADGLAAEFAAANRRAFHDVAAPTVGLASGCTAALAGDPNSFPGKIMDIHQFLVEEIPPETWRLRSLPKIIAVHEPCSLRNQLKTTEAVYALLRRIPDAEIVALPHNAVCCGGAGDYFLREPETARALRTAKLAAIDSVRPDIVVSANIGCRVQLGIGEPAVPIVHPLMVLAGQLAGKAGRDRLPR